MINFCRDKLGFLWDEKEQLMQMEKDEYIKMHEMNDYFSILSEASEIPKNRLQGESFFRRKQ